MSIFLAQLIKSLILSMAYFLKWTGSRKFLFRPLAFVLSKLLWQRFKLAQAHIYQALLYVKQQQAIVDQPQVIKSREELLAHTQDQEHSHLNHPLNSGNLTENTPEFPLLLGLEEEALKKLSLHYTHRFFEHFARLCLEIIEFTSYQSHEIEELIDISGLALIDQALAVGKGVLLLSLHLGNWELMIQSASLVKHTPHVISKEMSQGFAQTLLEWIRGKGIVRGLYGKNQAKSIIKALKENQIVVDVLDQHSPQAKAIACDFFGRTCYTTADFFRIADIAKCPILFIYQYRVGDRFKIKIQKIDEINELPKIEDKIKWVMHHYERLILSHFDQWLWIHRRWKDRKEIKSNKTYLQS